MAGILGPVFAALRERTPLHLGWVATVGILVGVFQRESPLERVIFTGHHIPMAEWLSGLGPIPPTPAFPSMGYAVFLAALRSPEALLALQVALGVVAWQMWTQFMLTHGIRTQRWLSAIFLLFFFAGIATMTPGALATDILVFIAVWALRGITDISKGYTVFAALGMAVVVHLRFEWFLWPLWFGGLSLMFWGWKAASRSLQLASVFMLSALLSWSPWVAFQTQHHREWVLTPTNGGMLNYISLGQLPGNPWGIVPVDQTAREKTASLSQNTEDKFRALTREGDKLLRAYHRDMIREHPVAFSAKVVWNASTAFSLGYFGGDFVWKQSQGQAIENAKDQIHASIRGDFPEAWDWQGLSRLIWRGIGIPIGALINAAALFQLFRSGSPRRWSPWMLVTFSLWTYQWAICSVLQSQPRHMSLVLLFTLPWVSLALTRRASSATENSQV